MELTTLSVQAWRDALLAEDTEAFLSVARNYLGTVPTPFNKHALVARLEAFLKQPQTAEAQAALLDSLDARILGALAAAGPCPEGFLRELFADERGPWEVSLRLSNLRDRLILFRAPGPKGPVLAVTPALAPRLGREADLRGLLGCRPAEGPAPPPLVDSDTVCALASVLFHEDGSLRRDGRPAKRARARLAALLPELGLGAGSGEAGLPASTHGTGGTLGTVEPGEETLDALLAGFRGAGFLSGPEGSREVPDMERLAAAAEDWGERLPFLLAAASLDLSFRPDADPAPPPPRSSLEEGARFLEAVAAALPPGAAVAEGGLRRLALLRLETRGTAGAARAEASAEALLRFGLVRRTPAGLVRAAPSRRLPRAAPEPAGTDSPAGTPPGPVLAVEASHALTVLPEADPAARAFAGTVARLESRGEVWSCVLDRRSVRRALDAGLGSERIARTLEELSGRPLPQSLAFSLAGWEKEHLSVRLYYGYVLAADGPSRTRAENAPSLAGLRGEAVAEGVWLLEGGDPGLIRAALEKAGIPAPRIRRAGFRAEPLGTAPARGTPGGAGTAFRLPETPPWARDLAAPDPAAGMDRTAGAGDPRARLRVRLAELDLPESRKTELAERIERRLILTEDQLARWESDGPGLEAGALDYLGKVRVVEKVLRTGGAVLEVLARGVDGRPERMRVRPLELEKTERGLVLRASDAEDGRIRLLPLSSLSRVKRIKTTLFGEEYDYDAQ